MDEHIILLNYMSVHVGGLREMLGFYRVEYWDKLDQNRILREKSQK